MSAAKSIVALALGPLIASPQELLTQLGYDPNFSRPYGLLWWLNIEPEVGVTERLLEL